jgi:hypothetical protein
MNPSTESNALFRAFVACLIVASLPIKNAAYVTPGLYLLILWPHGERRVLGRAVLLSSAVLMISSIAVLWDHLAGQTVNFPGVGLALLTYAPLLVVLCETFNRTIDQATYDKYAKVCVWFILLQSVVGVVQFVGTGNSDAVCGTMGLWDGFVPSVTIVQVYFTFVVFGMMLFLVPVASQWMNRVALATGAMICVLAQSGHQTIFFVATLLVCGMMRVSHFGTLMRTLAAAAVLSLLLIEVYPDTIFVAREWYYKVLDTSNSPKRLVYEGALSILAEPKNMLIGTGLGQYCSRAALMSSNEYLNVPLPSFMVGRSDYFIDHIRPSLVLFADVGEGSAMAKPYMSIISLPVEIGLVLTLVLFAVFCRTAVWCAGLTARNDGQIGWIGFTMMVGIIFFVLCCFIENYAEFSQAVFIPFILFVVAGSRAQTVLRAAESKQLTNRMTAGESHRNSFGLAVPPLAR